MKIESYSYPKSSFLSIEKDMSIITNHILKNERLKKLLYYTSKDCLSRPNLTDDETFSLFGKQIKILPKLYVDTTVENYIVISFDNFVTNSTNPEFRNNMIEFDILCHYDQWNIGDFQLRPYRIAAEIDSMFNDKHLTGIGELKFLGAAQILMTDEYAGLCLLYEAIHGEEDKIDAMNPKDQADIVNNFNQIFNNN